MLLQRLLKVARPRLYLIEQPHVFDGDHRLIAEGLKQLNVVLRKRARLLRVTLIMPIGVPLFIRGVNTMLR